MFVYISTVVICDLPLPPILHSQLFGPSNRLTTLLSIGFGVLVCYMDLLFGREYGGLDLKNLQSFDYFITTGSG